MRGSLWGLAVVSIGAGLLLRAVNVATPSSPTAPTQNVTAIFDGIAPVAGLLMLLFGLGALASMSFARGF